MKLIKLPEGYIIVSDEKVLETDLYYDTVQDSIKIGSNNNAEGGYKKKIIASTFHLELPQIDFSELSEDDCKKIEWFDVEKLSIDYSKDGYKDSPYVGMVKSSYQDGFQKALELQSDRKFTEEDIEKAYDEGMIKYTTKGTGVSKRAFIQSLSQLKSWDIEVEMEKPTLYTEDGLDYKGKLEPKITNNKIKITKVL